MFSRCTFFFSLFTLLAVASAQTQPVKKPNIIFILADDLGWTDLSCYGSKYYESPNIDRLASQGMRFTNGYSAGPNCVPTRAALLSGQYQPRTGIYTVGSIDRFNWQSRPLRPVDNITQLPLDKTTFASALKDAGYATAMFGKWHLGDQAEYHPSKRGFDEAIVSAGKHFDFETIPPTQYPKGQYLADFLTDKAVSFIQRNKDKPFLLYLPHFGVHAPHQAKPELIEKFKKKERAGGHHNPTYAAMIYSVDESVGRIMHLLDELKLADDTLVIFSSDNGGVGGYRNAGVSKANDVTDNAPLRGGKGMLYEGGTRVPFIFRFPGRTPPGSTSDTPIHSVDVYATLLELARAPRPEKTTLDGVSLLPVLASASHTFDRPLFWHFPGYLGAGADDWRTKPVGAIRQGDFKLLEFFEDNRLELYNLKTDPSQQQNLASEQPDLVKSMHDKLLAWRKETSAKMPTPNNEKSDAPRRRRRNRNATEDAD
jgi:arylsulfatase A-like enzyme